MLATHGLTHAIFDAINAHLVAKGLLLRQGSVVDATIISAPSSFKNDCGTRDPETHQTKKGNQSNSGMRAHTGAVLSSGLVHTLAGTAANVNDVTVGNGPLRRQETDVFADAGYYGVAARDGATGATRHVTMRLGVRQHRKKQPRICNLLDYLERLKAATRAKVEHPFHIITNRFGLRRSC